MTKSKRLLVIGICVLAAVASVQLLRSQGPRNTEPFLAEVPMSDGVHRLRLLKIVEGPLVYDWKDPSPALLRMLPLPAKLRPPYVPFEKVSIDGMVPYNDWGPRDTTPGYSFLFRVVDANGEYSATQGASRLSFVESTGHEFAHPNMFHEHSGFFGVDAFSRAVLPRRDKRLRIRVAEKYGNGAVLEFDVENPAYDPPKSEWVPETLPATKSFDGVDVELRGFNGGVIHPDVRVKRQAWIPRFGSFWLEDVTGNRGPLLSPHEPAWKLHGRLDPHGLECIRPERVWTVGEIDVPPEGVETSINLEREIDGVTLRLIKIVGGAVGSGQKNVKDDGPSNADQSGYRADCPWFELAAKSTHADFVVVPRVTYNGQVLWTHGRTSVDKLTRDMKRVFKKLPANSKVRIEIGVGRPIDVEFLIDPNVFKSASERSR